MSRAGAAQTVPLRTFASFDRQGSLAVTFGVSSRSGTIWRVRSLQQQIIPPGPCASCDLRSHCREGFACNAFERFVQTGKAFGDRRPAREIYVQLFASELGPAGLHRFWRTEGAKRSSAAQRGEVQKLSREEIRRRWRAHERVLFEIDPARRERHLARKRADAIRRERARGRRPMTPERAAARSRLAWQRRRARAAAQGLVMSGEEIHALRVRLGWTQKQLATAIGRRRSSLEHWELSERGAPPAAVKNLRELEKMLLKIEGASAAQDVGARAAPAGAVTLGSGTHA